MTSSSDSCLKSFSICICGGGSLGTVCAGVFASKGVTVNLLTGHPSSWSHDITVSDCKGNIFSGKINKISSEANDVVPDCDMVLLCVPGYLIEKTLLEIKPYVSVDTLVGSIVGSTGFFFFAHQIFGNATKLFAFQRVPFISRYAEYGASANLLGYKDRLKVVLENCDLEKTIALLESMFLTPVDLLDNYLEVSLSNSNPILHTGRLYAMWKDYKGEIYDKPILFYAEWTDESSEIVLKMDEEFSKLKKILNIPEDSIPSLLDYYEVKNIEEFSRKINSIPAFKGIQSPMKESEGGWIPDFNSRYFTEDFPFGLKHIHDLAQKNNLETPVINQVFEWGLAKCDEN